MYNTTKYIYESLNLSLSLSHKNNQKEEGEKKQNYPIVGVTNKKHILFSPSLFSADYIFYYTCNKQTKSLTSVTGVVGIKI